MSRTLPPLSPIDTDDLDDPRLPPRDARREVWAFGCSAKEAQTILADNPNSSRCSYKPAGCSAPSDVVLIVEDDVLAVFSSCNAHAGVLRAMIEKLRALGEAPARLYVEQTDDT